MTEHIAPPLNPRTTKRNAKRAVAPPVELIKATADQLPDWLSRMEAAFTAGLREAGLQPGEEPIPEAEEMAEGLGEPGTETLQIVRDGKIVGGASVSGLKDGHRSLELFFIDAGNQGSGIGVAAWRAIEARYPDTEVWETDTPYFDQRNIHFYVNRCGFHATEFFHPGHRPDYDNGEEQQGPSRMFHFEKRMAR